MKELNKDIQQGRERIDDVFQEAFGGYEIEPSKAVWSNIETSFLKPKFVLSY